MNTEKQTIRTATPELRWVKRFVPITEDVGQNVLILQQKFTVHQIGTMARSTEWVDVPTE